MGKKDVEEPPPPPYQEIVQPQTILVYERSDRVTYQDAPQQVGMGTLGEVVSIAHFFHNGDNYLWE